jgi:hypothetical protein
LLHQAPEKAGGWGNRATLDLPSEPVAELVLLAATPPPLGIGLNRASFGESDFTELRWRKQ